VLHRIEGRIAAAAAAVVLSVALSGCAGTVTRWMVDLRTSQGDSALARSSLVEAQKEYELALRLDPHDARARASLARVLLLQAHADFDASALDQAETEISEARKYAPADAAAQALASQIEQAKIRREIVLSNYPLYESVGTSLGDSLKTLTASQKEIAKQLKGFAADFDTGHLTKAITAAYDVEDEAHRVTLRLISYRGLVSSGAAASRAPAESETPSLLPIP
jgi:tetratricopeptide (TPR) repeat protein